MQHLSGFAIDASLAEIPGDDRPWLCATLTRAHRGMQVVCRQIVRRGEILGHPAGARDLCAPPNKAAPNSARQGAKLCFANFHQEFRCAAPWGFAEMLQNKVYIKGEIADPCASRRRPPTAAIRQIIGKSQYFLRAPRKRKNSAINSILHHRQPY